MNITLDTVQTTLLMKLFYRLADNKLILFTNSVSIRHYTLHVEILNLILFRRMVVQMNVMVQLNSNKALYINYVTQKLAYFRAHITSVNEY